jgi:hypothetical protein
MSRYFTRAAIIGTPSPFNSGYMLDADSGLRTVTVHEDDLETFTGLLDASGHEIHRSERIALGFGRT